VTAPEQLTAWDPPAPKACDAPTRPTPPAPVCRDCGEPAESRLCDDCAWFADMRRRAIFNTAFAQGRARAAKAQR